MKEKTNHILIAGLILFGALLLGCNESVKETEKNITPKAEASTYVQNEDARPKRPLSQEFKNYWYAGNAELTSYELEQARYGELRSGKAVLIFVTEPFLPNAQVKADRAAESNIPVLKLNSTKKYLTGIYPYSVMTSTFYPVYDNQHALKSTFSMQEWCGHVYTQLNNRDKFELKLHSYFESEGDQEIELEKTHLEDEIWTKIRINPEGLPLGEIDILPSLEYFRLKHQPTKPQKAMASMVTEKGQSTYILKYTTTERELNITFSENFPYEILEWTEKFKSGFGANAKLMTSKATKLKTLKTPYWTKNSNIFVSLRDSLAL